MRDDVDEVLRERRRLLALGYRMTGTLADAEDIVQETYVRWYRLSETERDAIANPAGWLTTVAGRIALDLLGSAHKRREQYVGQWLPEPLPVGALPGPSQDHSRADPLDRVTLDEDVSIALLVVLESMTPAERVAFVLHDVFDVPFAEIAETVGRSPEAVRQLASSGRRHVREHRATAVSRGEHDRIVRAFHDAAGTGIVDELMRLLAPDVELRSDGGGVVSAARNVVTGAENVARFLLGIAGKRPDMVISPQEFADGIGFAFHEHGAIVGILNARVVDEHIDRLWVMMNPAKLTHWVPESGSAEQDPA